MLEIGLLYKGTNGAGKAIGKIQHEEHQGDGGYGLLLVLIVGQIGSVQNQEQQIGTGLLAIGEWWLDVIKVEQFEANLVQNLVTMGTFQYTIGNRRCIGFCKKGKKSFVVGIMCEEIAKNVNKNLSKRTEGALPKIGGKNQQQQWNSFPWTR